MKRRPESREATAAFESATAASKKESYVLRLYVTGMTPRSIRAFTTLKTLCEEHLQGSYELQVIDIYQHPKLLKDEQILAVPTLIKKLPPPVRRLVGDLSDEERVLMGLDLRSRTQDAAGTETGKDGP